jgi:hypothetical protein
VSASGKVKAHCQHVSAKARKLTGLMLRTFRSRESSVIVPVLRSIIRPVIEYATAVWNPKLVSDVDELERVQRKVTKRIRGMRPYSYHERLRRLGLPTLAQRRLYYDLLGCFKIVHGLVRCDCRYSLAFSSNRTRGQNCKLISTGPTPRLNLRKGFFLERVLFQWNALLSELLSCDTLATFRAALRDHLRV